MATRYETPQGERGPVRALVEPLLLLLLGGAAAWAYMRYSSATSTDAARESSSRTAVSVAASEAAPGADELRSEPAAPTAPAAAEAEMPDVTARCPLSSGAAPRYASVTAYWQEGAAGFAQAEREQSLSRAPMMVYFFTDWCGYCKSFDREVLADADVDRFLGRRVVKVRVNPENGADERSLADRFANRGYPSLYLVLPGAEPREMSTTLRNQAYDPPRFVAAIQKEIDRRAAGYLHDAYNRRRSGDAAGAIELLDEALALAPENVRAYQERAQAYLDRDDLSRALDDMATLLALDPNQADLYGRAGEALGGGGRHDEAVACWSRFLEAQPGSAPALFGRSRSHEARGDRARARADAAEACRRGEPRACQLAATR